MIASIPSPDFNSIDIGDLSFRMYGVMIALGVLAAVWLMGRRLAAVGYSPEHAAGIAMWAVPAGIVGARLYHVITDWRSFEGRWGDAFKIWEGGLGILGGVMAGTAAALLYFRSHGLDSLRALDIAAPSLPLAQAIGRWGNWFNQELFGKPTDLPWGLEIDADHRPADHLLDETFHPTFLYESLWNIGVVFALLAIERSRRLERGRLFAAYIGLYAVGRLWIEALRIDPASEILGLRVNLWVFTIVLLSALAVVLRGLRAASVAPDPDGGSVDVEASDDATADPDDPEVSNDAETLGESRPSSD